MGKNRTGRRPAPDLTEKFFASIQAAARQEDATRGAAVRTARISGDFKTNSRADILRDYADEPDGMEYAAIAGGFKPRNDDPVMIIEGEGGPIVVGRPWRPGERDLEQVDDAKFEKGGGTITGTARLDASAQPNPDGSPDSNIIPHVGYVNKKASDAENAAKNASADKGHGHKSSDNNMDTFASKGHTHGENDLPSGIVYASELEQDKDGYLLWKNR